MVTFTTSTGGAVKVAVIDLSSSIVIAQVVPVPEQAPDQPEKVEPAEGVSVKATVAPEVKEAVPVLPVQLITPAEEVMFPEPAPDLVMVRV